VDFAELFDGEEVDVRVGEELDVRAGEKIL
jgi:hypothetical protein